MFLLHTYLFKIITKTPRSPTPVRQNILDRRKRTRVQTRLYPVRFQDSQSESSTTPPAPTRTLHAPTKRKSLLMPTSNAKSCIRPQRKSPPEPLADPLNQNRCSRSPDEVTASAPSQASTEIKTNFRMLVDGEPQTREKPPVSKTDRKIRAGSTSIELKLYCSVRRVKSDGPLPSRVADLRLLANRLTNVDPIELKEYIMDQEAFAEDLVNFILRDYDAEVPALGPRFVIAPEIDIVQRYDTAQRQVADDAMANIQFKEMIQRIDDLQLFEDGCQPILILD